MDYAIDLGAYDSWVMAPPSCTMTQLNSTQTPCSTMQSIGYQWSFNIFGVWRKKVQACSWPPRGSPLVRGCSSVEKPSNSSQTKCWKYKIIIQGTLAGHFRRNFHPCTIRTDNSIPFFQRSGGLPHHLHKLVCPAVLGSANSPHIGGGCGCQAATALESHIFQNRFTRLCQYLPEQPQLRGPCGR